MNQTEYNYYKKLAVENYGKIEQGKLPPSMTAALNGIALLLFYFKLQVYKGA